MIEVRKIEHKWYALGFYTDVKFVFEDGKEAIYDSIEEFTLLPSKPVKAYVLEIKKVLKKAIDKKGNEISAEEYLSKLEQLKSKGYVDEDEDLFFDNWEDERAYKDFIYSYDLIYEDKVYFKEVPIIEIAPIEKIDVNDYIEVNVTHKPTEDEGIIGVYYRKRAIKDKFWKVVKELGIEKEVSGERINLEFIKLFGNYVFPSDFTKPERIIGRVDKLKEQYERDMEDVEFFVKKILYKQTNPVELAKKLINLINIDWMYDMVKSLSVRTKDSQENKRILLDRLKECKEEYRKFVKAYNSNSEVR